MPTDLPRPANATASSIRCSSQPASPIEAIRTLFIARQPARNPSKIPAELERQPWAERSEVAMVIASGGEGAAHVAIDIAGDATEQQLQLGVCRICQLEDGDVDERVSGRLARLGCGCRGELAVAHRRCAEAWFSIRGDSLELFSKGYTVYVSS
ncbi:hypothetical protein EJB05_33004, partial [Eragrostis curvula]